MNPDKEPEDIHEDREEQTLADQALEAIIKSQQLRERSRRLRGTAKEEAQ